jgi:hypothetical protein
MYSPAEVVEFLFECHGGTIDVTFKPVPRARLTAFLQWLWTIYQVQSATDDNGDDCKSSLQYNDAFWSERGHVHAVVRADDRLLPHMQLLIDWESNKYEYCLEVSFFPEDIDRSKFTLPKFQAEIEQWQSLLQAENYFVRQENASWKLYDSKDLGVIYTRKHPPLA